MPDEPNPLENIIEETLFAISQELLKRGSAKMDADTLVETYQRLQHPEVLKQLQDKRLTPSSIVDHVVEGLRVMQEPRTPTELLGRAPSRDIPDDLGDANVPQPEWFTFQSGKDFSGTTPSLGMPINPLLRSTARPGPSLEEL